MAKLITALFLLIGVSFSPVAETEIHKTDDFDIEDYQWLAGTWTGNGFGGVSEESWSLPIDGTMMGMYRHHINGKITFYEFFLLDENGIRLKHFNPDLTSWEEKNDMVTFPMISFSKTKIEMEGLVFELKSENEIEIQLQVTQNGQTSTEIINMKRVL